MDGIIILLTMVLALAGACVGFWSILNTRKKYLDEFLERKRDGSS